MGRNARDFLRFVSSQWKYFAAVLGNQIIYLILIFFPSWRAVYLATPLVISLLKHQRNNDTIADIFRQTVSKHPLKTAFFYEQKTWKFQEVEDFANRIANYFKSQGYKKGDKVALLLESCPEFVCIWLGLSKLGVITALINTNLKRDSLWHCVSAVEVKAMIFGTDFSGTVRPTPSFSQNSDPASHIFN